MTHPIEGLMKTAMESIQQIVDVNTVVGDAVETPDGQVIIPISKVACGFAAGGSEFPAPDDGKPKQQQAAPGADGDQNSLPFGGGSGAGVSVQPVGFLVVGNGSIRLLPVEGNANAIVDRVIDTVPDLIDRIASAWRRQDQEEVGEI